MLTVLAPPLPVADLGFADIGTASVVLFANTIIRVHVDTAKRSSIDVQSAASRC